MNITKPTGIELWLSLFSTLFKFDDHTGTGVSSCYGRHLEYCIYWSNGVILQRYEELFVPFQELLQICDVSHEWYFVRKLFFVRNRWMVIVTISPIKLIKLKMQDWLPTGKHRENLRLVQVRLSRDFKIDYPLKFHSRQSVHHKEAEINHLDHASSPLSNDEVREDCAN